VQINLETERVTVFVLHGAHDLTKMASHYAVCIFYESNLIFINTLRY